MAHGVNPIPPLEDRCQQLIVNAKLSAQEIRVLWETFQKYDTGSTGAITQDQFHNIINDEELLFFFGMCLFDLIGARNYKALNFSDFTYACLTLSMFGQEELLRFSFNCFDPERNGTIDLSDFNMMSRLLHARSSIAHGVTALTHNVETVLARMDKWVQDDLRIDYDEFVESNRLYPWILKPAEKFRRKIRNVTFGDDWWRDRITALHWERQARIELLQSSEKRKNRWEQLRDRRAKLRKVRRRMGIFPFYMCPFLRPFYRLSCWDPKRKVSKLKNDAIKARLESRYKATQIEVVPYEEVVEKKKEIKELPPQARVEDKVDRREERKQKRKEKKVGGGGGTSRADRAARSKEKRAEKAATKKAGRTAKI